MKMKLLMAAAMAASIAAPAAAGGMCHLPKSEWNKTCIGKEIDLKVFVPCMRRIVPGIGPLLAGTEKEISDEWLRQILLRRVKTKRHAGAIRWAFIPSVYGKPDAVRASVYRIGIKSCVDVLRGHYAPKPEPKPRNVTRL